MRIRTSYLYDGATGELTNTNYNDGTANLTARYNRLGQIDQIDDSTGQRTFSFDSANGRPWRLASEQLSGYFGSRALHRVYENSNGPDNTTFGAQAYIVGRLKGRSVGYDLKNGAAVELHQHATYTNLQRFVGITVGAAGVTRDFAYNYVADSLLVGGYLAGPNFGVTRIYEPTRNLLKSIESTWTAGTSMSTVTRFAYTHNDAGQRTTAEQSGTAFADFGGPAFNTYGYNSRGELESARHYSGNTRPVDPSEANSPGRRFEYRYDSIGNRKTAGATGTTADDTFQANDLNQYASRENKSVTVSGTVAPNAQVAVQVPAALGTVGSVSRLGRAWAATVTPAANPAGPKGGSASIYAGIPGTGGAADALSATSKNIVVMAAFEQLGYDLDGNLESDGRWTYTYDAENRIVEMNTSAATRNLFGVTWQRISFAYDYQGRRVEKKVATTVDGVNFTASLQRRFVYDGWNLIGEFNYLAGNTLVRSYAWGLDLTGSLSRSAGVGALLQMTNHTAGQTYWATYDGNGNVASLVNSSTGVLAAAYEYDPFGNPLRSETPDSAAADNPFRFSTKYHDAETGLVYYGFRYYSSSLGRFINRDPIEERGGLNLYGFVGNDGVNRWDYLGMDEMTNWLLALSLKDDKVIIPPFPATADAWTSGDEMLYQWSIERIISSLPPIRFTNGTGFENTDKTTEEDPNKPENPDCAKLRARLAQAREIQARNVAKILPGGMYAGGVSLSTNDTISLTAGFVGGVSSGLDLALRDRAPLQGPLGTEIWRGNGAANTFRTLSYGAAGVSIAADGYAFVTANNGVDRALAGGNLATTAGVLTLDKVGLALLGPSVTWIGPAGLGLAAAQVGINSYVGYRLTFDQKEILQANAQQTWNTANRALETAAGIEAQMGELRCK